MQLQRSNYCNRIKKTKGTIKEKISLCSYDTINVAIEILNNWSSQ